MEEHTLEAIKEKLTKTWKSFYNENNEIKSALYSQEKINEHYKSLITQTNKDNDCEKNAKTILKDYLEQKGDLYSYPYTNCTTINSKPCKVGESFGYEWYVASFIWGPYKKDLSSKSGALIKLK